MGANGLQWGLRDTGRQYCNRITPPCLWWVRVCVSLEVQQNDNFKLSVCCWVVTVLQFHVVKKIHKWEKREVEPSNLSYKRTVNNIFYIWQQMNLMTLESKLDAYITFIIFNSQSLCPSMLDFWQHVMNQYDIRNIFLLAKAHNNLFKKMLYPIFKLRQHPWNVTANYTLL